MKSLQKKNVRACAKNGWSTVDFCDKYRCTEDEFVARVNQIFKDEKSAKECLDKIAGNAGKRRPKSKTEAKKPNDELKTLKTEEATLIKEAMKLEKEWYDLKERHRERRQDLRDKLNELKTLRADIEKEKKKTEKLIQRSSKVVDSMNGIAAKYKEKVSALDETRELIKKMSKVTLCVFDDGIITNYEDSSSATLDDNGHENIYTELVKSEYCDNLRQREVKVLARLLAMSENSALEVDVICDSKELEEAFGTLKKRKE